MIKRLRLKSLAKINLDLRVLHKRSDGFHELRTVFQTISLADSIEVDYQSSRRTRVTIDDPLAIPNKLIVRAAEQVLDSAKAHAQVHFRLRKRIPMGGGLGGGSSNAAAILLALPVLARSPVPVDTLQGLASALGSDVPFFLHGGTALGLGRGEELYPLADLRAEPLLLVSSGLHVSTPEAYRGLGRSLTFIPSSSSINSFQGYVRALGEGRSAAAASAFSANDFEGVVFRKYPLLGAIQRRLWKLGAAGVRMTGSGSAMVALFDSRAKRAEAEASLDRDRVFEGSKVIASSLVSRAAYHRMWRNQLREYLAEDDQDLWPPHARYGR